MFYALIDPDATKALVVAALPIQYEVEFDLDDSEPSLKNNSGFSGNHARYPGLGGLQVELATQAERIAQAELTPQATTVAKAEPRPKAKRKASA